MQPYRSECDATSVVLALIVFLLPLTLLIPDFSLWEYVPKIHVTRCFLIYQSFTWSELNAILIGFLLLFFSFYLEIGKRKLDEMVGHVINVSQATEAAMEIERGRQDAAIRACVELLDASSDHYENLMLLRSDLRMRGKMKLQHPPTIEPSSSTVA